MASQLPGVIIPAYQPGPPLSALVDELLREPYPFVIVVDDGSDPERRPLFDALEARPRVRVLRHAVNLGKGDALKTGFNDALVHFPDSPGVVTADADGQHLAGDVLRVARALAEAPNDLWLGARGFSGRVPWRSRLGNGLTRQVFRLLVGGGVRDTQTGLRGIPASFLRDLLSSKAARYEFELQMLIRARELGIACREVPIATVYDAGNAGSHFDPLLDSLRIYFVFLRFVVSSMLTAGIDMLAFSIAYGLGAPLFASAAVGRLVAGSFNFAVNKRIVFKSDESVGVALAKYAALVAAMATASYLLILEVVSAFQVNVYLAKLLVEGTFFLLSFAGQRLLVFGSGRERWSS